MSFLKVLRMIYGVFMGMSVEPLGESTGSIKYITLDDSLLVQIGGETNCLILHTRNSILLINTNQGESAKDLRQAAGPYLRNRKLIIVNTSLAPECSDGNSLYEKPYDLYDVSRLRRFEQKKPTSLSKDNKLSLDLGEEQVEIYCVNNNGPKLIVYIVQRNIVYLGDLFYNQVFPAIHPNQNINEWIQTLQTVRRVLSPANVIPAVGPMGPISDLENFTDYLTNIADRNQTVDSLKLKYISLSNYREFNLAQNVAIARSKSVNG